MSLAVSSLMPEWGLWRIVLTVLSHSAGVA